MILPIETVQALLAAYPVLPAVDFEPTQDNHSEISVYGSTFLSDNGETVRVESGEAALLSTAPRVAETALVYAHLASQWRDAAIGSTTAPSIDELTRNPRWRMQSVIGGDVYELTYDLARRRICTIDHKQGWGAEEFLDGNKGARWWALDTNGLATPRPSAIGHVLGTAEPVTSSVEYPSEAFSREVTLRAHIAVLEARLSDLRRSNERLEEAARSPQDKVREAAETMRLAERRFDEATALKESSQGRSEPPSDHEIRAHMRLRPHTRDVTSWLVDGEVWQVFFAGADEAELTVRRHGLRDAIGPKARGALDAKRGTSFIPLRNGRVDAWPVVETT